MASFAGFSLFLSIAVLVTSSACSRRATCALEGCSKNGGVILATDFQSEQKPAQDADAVAAETSALEKEIESIKARMDLNEAMTKLLGETIDLQEKRIATLEENSAAVDEALIQLDDRVIDTEHGIDLISEQIAALEIQINGSSGEEGQAGLLQILADLQSQQENMRGKLQNLKNRVKSLEQFRENQRDWNQRFASKLKTIKEKVKTLKDHVNSEATRLEIFAQELVSEAMEGVAGSLTAINGDITDLGQSVDQIEASMATDAELSALELQVITQTQINIDSASDILAQRIASVELALAAHSECSVTPKYREGLLWFRNLTCDGVTMKILVL